MKSSIIKLSITAIAIAFLGNAIETGKIDVEKIYTETRAHYNVYVEEKIKENVERQIEELPDAVEKHFREDCSIIYVKEKALEDSKDYTATIDGESIGRYVGSTNTVYITLNPVNMQEKTLFHEAAHYMDVTCGHIFKEEKETALEEYYGGVKDNFLFYSCSAYKDSLDKIIDTVVEEYYAEAFCMYMTYPEEAKQLMPKTCEVLERAIQYFEEREE